MQKKMRRRRILNPYNFISSTSCSRSLSGTIFDLISSFVEWKTYKRFCIQMSQTDEENEQQESFWSNKWIYILFSLFFFTERICLFKSSGRMKPTMCVIQNSPNGSMSSELICTLHPISCFVSCLCISCRVLHLYCSTYCCSEPWSMHRRNDKSCLTNAARNRSVLMTKTVRHWC